VKEKKGEIDADNKDSVFLQVTMRQNQECSTNAVFFIFLCTITSY